MNRSRAITGRRPRRRLVAAWCACLALFVASCAGRTANADETTAPPQPAVVLVNLDDAAAVQAWTTVNDPVMGGRSTSQVTFGDPGLVFSGTLSLENNGGFASARGPNDSGIGQRAAGATSLLIRARGDGKTYVLKVGAAGQPWSYIQRFATEAGVQRVYALPVGGFQPVGMRLDPAPDAPQTLDPSTISQVAVYILDKQEGPFDIAITGIDAAV